MNNNQSARFLIIDGYSKQSRDDLEKAGMAFAWQLYANMLKTYLPDAEYDILLPSDEGVSMPDNSQLEVYGGIIWTGCNLSVNDTDNPSVSNQIEMAKRIYQIGTPSWGSCWGLQIAVVAAGGKVVENPKGREMGFARKIQLTDQGKDHPMYEGKASVFDAYISHDDMVSEIPEGGVVLSGNDFTAVQSMEVRHQNGVFWATQYHPEYDLHEMASLMIAREEKLTNIGYFSGHEDFITYVNLLKDLFAQPNRKDLRWQLAVDDDVLDQDVKRCEFRNWINKQVVPYLKR
ncbi:MAG: type 1 glutamine amidotransferase [Proteobacteria bacterium]|nr:type 1 glutamine amidotransferase [Pseudomonadota bacterium]